MIAIKFIVPYFGKLPPYFQIWLDSCKTNPTIDWIIFTDDKTKFCYPENVKVIYLTFDEVRMKIQQAYDFEICLSKPYKLCDYKIAYGEIFSDYLKDADFWGFCDIDLIWGDIRSFFSDEILTNYDKIGVQGHCTIFKNTQLINTLYRKKIQGYDQISDYFQRENIGCLDKNYIADEFRAQKLKVYEETIYAGLHKYFPGFYLQGMGKEENDNSKYNLFLWDNGKLTRFYLDKGILRQKDYLYIHFFCRPMKNLITKMDRVIICPDYYKSYYGEINPKIVRNMGKKSLFSFYFRVFKQNRKRISLSRIHNFIMMKRNYKIIQ